MKPFAISVAAFLLLASAAYGQNDTYYHSDERQIPLEKAEHWAVIQLPQGAQSALEAALAGQSDVRLRKVLDPGRDFYWLEAKGGQPLDPATSDALSSQVPIQRTFPAFFRRDSHGDTTRFLTTDQFSAKFAPGVSRAEIDAFNEKQGVEVVPLDNEIDRWQASEHNEYPLRVTEASDLSALETANRYYESALTVWSVPSFYVNLRTDGPVQSRSSANDPLYPEQYYLNNTSSNLGTPDVDIDAPETWSLSKGSSSITVAVVDKGVEEHEDFRSGQLVAGTSAGDGNGSPERNQKHGQAVAGIIAANHNSKGVRGVAPNVKIMPINIFDGPYGEETADAIDYAWQTALTF